MSVRNNVVNVLIVCSVVPFVVFTVASETVENGEILQADNSSQAIKEKNIQQRTFRFAEKFVVPFLVGALVKLSAVIPVVLLISIFVGAISLIGSKLSLVISLILGIKALMSMAPAQPKEPPTITEEDFNDLQHLFWKNTEKPPNYQYWPSGYGHHDVHSYPDEHVYYPVHPTGMSVSDDHGHIVASNERVGIRDYGNSENRMKILAASEMVSKAHSALMQKTIENPKGKIGIKITKTVLKQ